MTWKASKEPTKDLTMKVRLNHDYRITIVGSIKGGCLYVSRCDPFKEPVDVKVIKIEDGEGQS